MRNLQFPATVSLEGKYEIRCLETRRLMNRQGARRTVGRRGWRDTVRKKQQQQTVVKVEKEKDRTGDRE